MPGLKLIHVSERGSGRNSNNMGAIKCYYSIDIRIQFIEMCQVSLNKLWP